MLEASKFKVHLQFFMFEIFEIANFQIYVILSCIGIY